MIQLYRRLRCKGVKNLEVRQFCEHLDIWIFEWAQKSWKLALWIPQTKADKVNSSKLWGGRWMDSALSASQTGGANLGVLQFCENLDVRRFHQNEISLKSPW